MSVGDGITLQTLQEELRKLADDLISRIQREASLDLKPPTSESRLARKKSPKRQELQLGPSPHDDFMYQDEDWNEEDWWSRPFDRGVDKNLLKLLGPTTSADASNKKVHFAPNSTRKKHKSDEKMKLLPNQDYADIVAQGLDAEVPTDSRAKNEDALEAKTDAKDNKKPKKREDKRDDKRDDKNDDKRDNKRDDRRDEKRKRLPKSSPSGEAPQTSQARTNGAVKGENVVGKTDFGEREEKIKTELAVGDKVKVMKESRLKGKTATVVNTNWNGMVKVNMDEDDEKGKTKSFKPTDIVLAGDRKDSMCAEIIVDEGAHVHQVFKNASLGKLHRVAQLSNHKNCILYGFETMVLHPNFDNFSGLIVFANAALLGLTLQVMSKNIYGEVNGDLTIPIWSYLAEWGFLGWFTLEIVMRSCVHRFDYLRVGKSWKAGTVCDLVATMAMWVEQLWIVYDQRKLGLGLIIIRVLRSFRCLRVLSRYTKSGHSGEFHTVVASVLSSGKVFFFAVVFISIIVLNFGLFLSQLVLWHSRGFGNTLDEDCEFDRCLRDLYGTFGMTVLTLFQVITGGRGWADALDPLMDRIAPELSVVYALFIAFTVLNVMNAILGIFVDAAMSNAKKERDMQMVCMVRNFFAISTGIDGSEAGVISYEKFKSHLDDAWMLQYFEFLDVHISEAKRLFQLLDTDGSGSLEADEFLFGCMRLRGNARALDLELMMHDNKRFQKRVYTHAKTVERRLDSIIAIQDQLTKVVT